MTNAIETFKKTLDFEMLDRTNKITFYEDRMALVRGMGYQFLSEAIFDQYYVSKKSVKEIAASLSYTRKHIFYLMKLYGFAVHRRHGGNRKNPHLNKPGAKENILSLKGITSTRKAAELCKCSQTHVFNVWHEAS